MFHMGVVLRQFLKSLYGIHVLCIYHRAPKQAARKPLTLGCASCHMHPCSETSCCPVAARHRPARALAVLRQKKRSRKGSKYHHGPHIEPKVRIYYPIQGPGRTRSLRDKRKPWALRSSIETLLVFLRCPYHSGISYASCLGTVLVPSWQLSGTRAVQRSLHM